MMPALTNHRRRTGRAAAATALLIVIWPLLASGGRASPGHWRSGSVAAAPGSPQQVVFHVDSTSDATDASPGDGLCAAADGACTLRAAVREGNAQSGAATIRVPPGIYRLRIPGANEDASDSGDLDLRVRFTLVGDGGRDATIIRSDVADRVLHVTGPQVTIEGITVAGGGGVLEGGGVLAVGHLVLRDCAVIDNAADRPEPGGERIGDGGGIYVAGGELELERTVVQGNRAGYDGGGVFLALGGARVLDSRVTANRAGYEGGGIAVRGTDLQVVDSTIDDNVAGYDGGGINNYAGHSFRSSVQLTDSTVRGNVAGHDGGAVASGGHSDGAVTIVGSRLTGNRAEGGGGALAAGGWGDEELTVVASLLADNYARLFGGAAVFGGWGATAVTIDRSVLTSNAAGEEGGGLYVASGTALTVVGSLIAGNVARNAGGLAVGRGVGTGNNGLTTASLVNSTVSGNCADARGGGLALIVPAHAAASRVTVASFEHATVAENAAEGGANVYAGDFSAAGTSVVTFRGSILSGRGNSVDCVTAGQAAIVSLGFNRARDGSCAMTSVGDQANVDSRLAPLADNGGPSPSHLLLPESPAIDAVEAADCPATDQRGAPRPAGARCDVGAIELGGIAPAMPLDWPVPPRPFTPPASWSTSWPCVWPPAANRPSATSSPTASVTATPTPSPSGTPTVIGLTYPPPTGSATTQPSATVVTSPTPTASASVPATTVAPPPPSAVPSATPSPTPAKTASPVPTPVDLGVCPQILGRVPPAVVNDALANPARVYGFGMRLDPNKPAGPRNPPRRWLSLQNLGVPYHLLFNGLEYKAYCP